jgi:glycosyltransferase involved in cell wall biosynthesis
MVDPTGADPRPRARSIRVTQVITGLELGGAETMLLRLLGTLDRRRFAPEVISLRGLEVVGPRIQALGVPVHSVGMTGPVPSGRSLGRLSTVMRRASPDLVHTWMYHADLLGGLVARLVCRVPVIWALHNSNLDPRQVKASTRLTVRLNALLSRWVPARIVSCSKAAAEVHLALGYPRGKLLIIPNGFDLTALRPDPAARASVRAELGLPLDAVLVGTFARFHPQKDHYNFCRAAGLIAARHGNVHFVLAGGGIDTGNRRLVGWISESGAANRFHLLGARDDVPRLTAALDLAVMASSFGEAFPLVIGEAMACEVPCVVTDVGDAAAMVADTGRVVPPRDPGALARAALDLLGLDPSERADLGARARGRVEAELSLPAIAARYEALYEEVLATAGRRSG